VLSATSRRAESGATYANEVGFNDNHNFQDVRGTNSTLTETLNKILYKSNLCFLSPIIIVSPRNGSFSRRLLKFSDCIYIPVACAKTNYILSFYFQKVIKFIKNCKNRLNARGNVFSQNCF